MPTFAFDSVPTRLALTEVAASTSAAGGAPASGKAPRLTGSLQFSVTNSDPRRTRVGRLTVEPGASAQAGWFTFKEAPSTSTGPYEVDFEPNAKRGCTAVVAIPPDAPAGEYMFTIRASAIETDPDNDYARSSAVAFTVPEAIVVPVKKAKFPWQWAAAAAVVLLILAGGGIFLLTGSGQIKIPDLAGQDVVQAAEKLSDLGLQAVSDLRPAGQKPGTIISTQPPAGTLVDKAKPITLLIASPQNAPSPCLNRANPALLPLMMFCNRPLVLANKAQITAGMLQLRSNVE